MTSVDLPTVAAVAEAFRRALEAPDEPPDGLLGALLGLHANNLAQWRLEDDARDPAATDAAVAEAKRGIDRLNLSRHGFVERVDAIIDAAIARTAVAPPATESPGMAFDRLSVLVIRWHYTEAAIASPVADAGHYEARLVDLRDQIDTLVAALEHLLGELRRGERSFRPYRHLKLYGAPVEPATPASGP